MFIEPWNEPEIGKEVYKIHREDAFSAEEIEHVLWCLDQLVPKHRIILKMHFFDRMTYKEIGEAYGISNVRARQIVRRACQLIWAYVWDYEEFPGRMSNWHYENRYCR